ncbi:hypothetical protein ACFOWA_06720 [Pedobacter lithocola]|uniref:Uncharacterized protein n=1 Tax=Pedobacter lithocola TaxID=1908239 RepID=A0ABV8P8A2_9SPHI
MQPFNINIGQGQECQLYTIIPKHPAYAIMVSDNVVAVIEQEEGTWVKRQLSEVDIEDLHIDPSLGESLTQAVVDELGREIELVLAGLPEPNPDERCES